MVRPCLKLVSPIQIEPETLFMERRKESRRKISGAATALSSGNGKNPFPKRICSFQLLDISDSGIGGITQKPLEIGSQIAILFPPHGPDHGFDMYGTVARCREHDDGFEIGITLESRLAA